MRPLRQAADAPDDLGRLAGGAGRVDGGPQDAVEVDVHEALVGVLLRQEVDAGSVKV